MDLTKPQEETIRAIGLKAVRADRFALAERKSLLQSGLALQTMRPPGFAAHQTAFLQLTEAGKMAYWKLTAKTAL